MVKSLYIHIPFCDKICAYCDFAKVFSSSFSHMQYLKVLIEEIESLNIKDNSLETIYIGGGTPSSLKEEELEYLLSFLHSHFNNVIEFTLEANPESLTKDKMKICLRYGVNRISLGAQSANDKILKYLNRNHDVKTLLDCVSNLNELDFSNYNLDFIYGIKGMSMSDLDDDLKLVTKLNCKHTSFYSLQIEEGTMLYNKKTEPVSDEIMASMYERVVSYLEKNSLYRYEVSNFAFSGYESKHNLAYWHDNEYYAAGLSASSYVSKVRKTNTKSLTKYINRNFDPTFENISKRDEEFEFLMLNLRLVDGFSLSTFQERFNQDFLLSYKDNINEVSEYVSISDRFKIKPDYLFTMDNILLKLLK